MACLLPAKRKCYEAATRAGKWKGTSMLLGNSCVLLIAGTGFCLPHNRYHQVSSLMKFHQNIIKKLYQT